MCGYLACDKRPFNPLLESLPRMVHAPVSTRSWGWMAGLLDAAIEASDERDAGQEAMLAKLSELMFVEALRAHIDGTAARDAQLGGGPARPRGRSRAAGSSHGRFAEAWTLEQLARRGRDVSLVLRRPVHRLCGHPPDDLPGPLAAPARRATAAERLDERGAGGGRGRVPVRVGVQPGVQATGRPDAGRPAGRARSAYPGWPRPTAEIAGAGCRHAPAPPVRAMREPPCRVPDRSAAPPWRHDRIPCCGPDPRPAARSWRPDPALLDGLTIAAVALDADGMVIYANATALDLFGSPFDDLVDADARTELFDEPERGAVDQVLKLVRRTGSWTGELAMLAGGDQPGGDADVLDPARRRGRRRRPGADRGDRRVDRPVRARPAARQPPPPARRGDQRAARRRRRRGGLGHRHRPHDEGRPARPPRPCPCWSTTRRSP